MRISFLSVAALAVALSPVLVACAADPAESDNAASPADEGTEESELRSLSITEADDGKTVTVTEGVNLLVKLPANPSTGYKWEVVSTDRSFGYPSVTKFSPSSSGVGSGGVQRFTWKTKGALSLVGEHTVKMEYKRSWEKNLPATKTFTFTVDIVASDCPQLSPPAPGFCKGGTVKLKTDPTTGCATGYDCQQSCPEIAPPAPNLCPGGKPKAKTDQETGCVTGYEC
jgi:inhibitor of cysteine peptidase